MIAPALSLAIQTGIPLLDGPPPAMIVRLGLDLLCATVLVRGIYYRSYRRADLVFTFFALNLSIFLITFLLNDADMSMGAAFGLFAVFSMLRYRTENISAKDMTYVFLVISLGLIMAASRISWPALLVIGLMMLALAQLLESNLIVQREYSREVHYENAGLVHESKRAELIADLSARTGLDIHRVEVHEVDFLRDSARLTVYFHDPVNGAR
jgi:hypothetical protein